MDILAHGLWAALACQWCARKKPIARATLAMTAGLAMAPDLVQLSPIAIAALTTPDGWAAAKAYFLALPYYQPALPPSVELFMHHLHCAMHSALVAAGVTASVWARLGRFWIPLAGWWSHILIDVFTHSAEFYPSPVFYPITQKGFDGLAWNTPAFLVINYAAMTALGLWLMIRARNKRSNGA